MHHLLPFLPALVLAALALIMFVRRQKRAPKKTVAGFAAGHAWPVPTIPAVAATTTTAPISETTTLPPERPDLFAEADRMVARAVAEQLAFEEKHAHTQRAHLKAHSHGKALHENPGAYRPDQRLTAACIGAENLCREAGIVFTDPESLRDRVALELKLTEARDAKA